MAVSALQVQIWLGKTNKNNLALWQNSQQITSLLPGFILSHIRDMAGVHLGLVDKRGRGHLVYSCPSLTIVYNTAWSALIPMASMIIPVSLPFICGTSIMPSHQTTPNCQLWYVPCIYSTYVCYIHSGWKITYRMQLKLTVWTVAQNKGVVNGHTHYYLMLPYTANYSHTQLT